MNENFRKLYKESNYSAIGFSQIIGVSRQRFYSIINNKQVLRETTFYKYKIKFLKHQKRITKKRLNFISIFCISNIQNIL